MAQKFLTNFTPPGTSDLYKFRAGALFYGTTSNSTTAMTVSIPGVTEYYTGLTLILKMGAQAASGCTLNVNSLGAKAMKYGANSVGTYFTSGATYLFVYDGTDFKAIHSYNSNTTYTALKNPYALTIQGNGTTLTNGTYDGSSAKTVNITPASIGAAPSSHTHDDRYYTESEVNTKLNAKLDKLTYEWNKEYNAGGTAGYLLIGSFPMYDTNVTIDIDATTTTTYHGTVVIATQNVSTTSMGSAHTITVYGDPTGDISNAIRVTWASGSRNYNVYFVPSTWSKNLIHIRAIGQYMDTIDTTKICTQFTTGTAPTTTSGLTVVNALRSNFNNFTYTHPTSSGNKHIPAGGSSGQILRWSADGTAVWGNDNNTTYTFTNKAATLAWGTKSTIATVGGVDITVTMPANPNTNTHYVTGITAGATGTTSNSATTNGNTFIKIKDDSTHRGQIKIVGSGATTVTSDANGVITINSTDNNTVYTHPTSSGNKHIPSGGSSGQILRWSADGTAAWGSDNNSAHSHSAGVGLTGSGNAGTSGTYTYKVNLVNETAASNAASYTAGGTSKFYAVQLDKNNKLGVYVPWTDNNTTYSVVTSTANGLVPKFDAADGTIDSSSTDWVLTNNNGSIGWYKLPANAFKNDNTNYYHTRVYSSGLKISTGTGVSDMYVPSATGSQSGVVMMHPAANCTTFTSDDSTCTVAAVKKAVTLFTNDYAPTKTGGGASGTWGINVTGSAGSVAWGNITGKPSTFTPSSHSHDFITYKDTRADNQSPDDVQAGLTVHLKSNGTDGMSDGGGYHAILNVKDWGDYSGGPYWQSTVTANNNMHFRRSTAGTTWGTWQKVLSDNNYTDYTVTKTGGGASGTWGISITGNAATATKATQDGAGNVITSKYVTLDTAQTISGTKTMTGSLKVSGRYAGGGDDEGIIVGFADNGYAGLCLGGPSEARSVFYFKSDGTKPFWRYNNGTASYDISHPSKSGTIALTSDLANYLPLSGGTLTGLLNITTNGRTTTFGCQNNSYSHYSTTADAGHWFNKNVSVQGNIYAGSSYNKLVLTEENYTNYAPTKTGGGASGTWGINITGNANTASLWALTGTANTTTGHSDWDGGVGNTNKYTVYDQEWACSNIGSDTGDLRVFLRPGEYSSGGTEVCFAIDGDYYVMGNKVLHAGNYNNYAPTKTGGGASGTWGISITGNAATATTSSNSNWLNTNSTLQYGASGLNYFNISGTAGSAANANQTPTADWYHIIRMNHANSSGYYTDIASCFHNNNMYMKRVANGSSSGWLHIWVEGNSVTSAVWNDYAECRESDCEEFGYVLMEVGDDSLTKTTERLSHFAGVSSDTWGFSQGETDKAKTPIAVAGRVLVYPYQDRNNYKPGDCVCAAPGGTVDIMTREEVREWPDRIVGTVSCVPDYEEWGGGEGADRDPVKVNGRIWIKVK